MTVFFVFSDESGGYLRIRSANFLKKYPYYCRSALMVSAEDWIELRKPFHSLKDKWGIAEDTELKWDHIWLRTSLSASSFNSKYPDLSHLSSEQMLGFVKACVSELVKCQSCVLVFTVTENASVRNIGQERIWEMHLEDIMQRVEMRISRGATNLALFLLDNTEKGTEKKLRERYSALIKDGVLLKYEHIKDSIAFEYSHHSFAIQMADFCAGAFNGMLRGYRESSSVFRMLYPRVAKSRAGAFMGFGVCEVPTDRQGLRLRIEELIHKAVCGE
jgi:hypothetical protein